MRMKAGFLIGLLSLTPALAQVGSGGLGATTTTVSTTRHTTTSIGEQVSETTRGYRLIVRGIVVRGGAQEIVFEQAVDSALGLDGARDAIEQARQAVLAADATSLQSAREVTGEVQPPATATELEEIGRSEESSVTTQTSLGPGTILIGENQTETFFVAAGSTNININTHTETFVNQREVTTTTLTKTATFDVVGNP